MNQLFRLELTLWSDEEQRAALNIAYQDGRREWLDGVGHRKFLIASIELLQEQLAKLPE